MEGAIMLASRRWLLLLFVAGVVLSSAVPAHAGLGDWIRKRLKPAAGPANAYAPEMRHYDVIDPVIAAPAPKATKRGPLSYVPPPGQVLWRFQVEPAPTYPWGWFGARRQVQNTQHTRFYDDSRDWTIRRGD